MEELRLQKFLAMAGIASRRKAEELILQGRVSVDGIVVREMGTKVSADSIVKVDNQQVTLEERKVYIMLNKPVGYVTTAKDQFSRPAVIDLVKGISERLYPVGRLDYDTSGLILLTNDGEFTFRLTHPKHEIEKVYIAGIVGIPTDKEMESFREGLLIENYKTSQAKIRILNETTGSATVEIIIHEGKNRQVRKMCDAIGHPVVKLSRVAIGNVQLGTLKEGEWRHLSGDEIRYLYKV